MSSKRSRNGSLNRSPESARHHPDPDAEGTPHRCGDRRYDAAAIHPLFPDAEEA